MLLSMGRRRKWPREERESYITGIWFLCNQMLQKSEFITDDCANKFKLRNYHLLVLISVDKDVGTDLLNLLDKQRDQETCLGG